MLSSVTGYSIFIMYSLNVFIFVSNKNLFYNSFMYLFSDDFCYIYVTGYNIFIKIKIPYY